MKAVRTVAMLALCVLNADVPLNAADAAAVFPDGAKLELLWSDGEFTEGVASSPQGDIYFSDIAGKTPGRILKFDPKTKTTTVHCADSKKSNGLTFDLQGRLIACCGAAGGIQSVCEVLDSGELKPLVSEFEGKRLNAPNDLDIHPRGWIYFSDPRYGGPEPIEIDHLSVYRFDPRTGDVVRVTRDITKPNGVALSPDASTLYVAETDNGFPEVPGAGSGGGKVHMTLNAFPVDRHGNLGERRILKDFGKETGVDGLTVDSEGRIFAAVRAESRFGIGVYDSTGRELAFLKTPEVPTNCGFGRGDDGSTLYITAGKSLYRIPTESRGWFLTGQTVP
ncbi:Gluconolactonase precursor [Caulifigura coniformis]|uniref:Gluconolactonase n=1 Tax=Caulifigura coniformis TaxID=2527983 RepID=A0A517SLD9_9PLAN|nr:SMP-30/gluconolactonase/LRE family protein [Caulifigura coniformis]QDT56937.1 Gluconolactonase precursor [Caulifigura coniformis]